jgi:succinoglycan biosynthesis transport protein ExoP
MTDVPGGNRETARQLVLAGETLPATRDPYGRLALYYGESVDRESDQLRLTLLEYWRILYKHKWLIIGIAIVFTVIGSVRTLMETPLFTSSVRLQIDSPPRIVEGGNIDADSEDYRFMTTQYQLLESRTMAERVASMLKLGNDADFLKPKGFSIVDTVIGMLSPAAPPSNKGVSSSKGVDEVALEHWAAGVILGNRAVQPVTDSRLVDISYSDPDPTRAQRIANAYADAFIASNIDKRFQANESAKIFLEDKIEQLKQRLQESEHALIDFAEKQQIVGINYDSDQKTSIAEANLANASAELQKLTSERTKNEGLWRQAQGSDAINLPQVLSDSEVGGLRNKRNELQVEYQQGLQTFKPDYPSMVDIRAKIEEIDRQLADQLQTIKVSLKATYEASLAREKEMTTRVAQLKQDLLDLQKRSVEYNILKREVDTNRELYASLLQRYKEVDVASGAGSTNVFVVERALPGAPSSGSLYPALLKALALGLGIGVGLAYLLEKLDDKIRSPEQLEQVTGLSVLGVIPKVRRIDQELADPRSRLGEAHRSLCTALQFTTENGAPKTLMVTSAAPAEGKSFTSLAIAKQFATLGRKVLLIDADLRNASLHVKLSCDNSVGLSNYLVGSATPPEVMQKTGVPNLAFLASGPLPPNAADLLGSARLVSLLSIGSEIFDLIVIDGPPILGLADAILLSSAASATIFIVGAGGVRTGLVRGALKRLQLSRGSVIGAVLSQYDSRSVGYGYGYGYEYRYSYNYNYGADANPRGLSIKHSGERQEQLTHAQGSA